MIPRAYKCGLVLLALALIPAGTWAGDSKSQSTFGSTFLSVSPPCPVKRLPGFEVVAPIPKVVDPFADDFVPVFCQIQVSREGKNVRRARGNFTAELLTLDNNTGMTDLVPVDSGSFRTGKNGTAELDFKIPTDIFADGFESGDVSAWSYTRADFSNRKRAGNVSMSCGTSNSSSN